MKKRERLVAPALTLAVMMAPAALAERAGAQEPLALGLTGFVAFQHLDLSALNAQLGGAPPLPATGWSAGYGVTLLPESGWGFVSSDSSFRWESRREDAMTRLELGHVQVGLIRPLAGGPRAALTAAGLVGLGSAQLEVVAKPPQQSGAAFYDPTMNRFTRHVLTLEVQLGFAWRLGPASALVVGAGYLLGTDFWAPGWTHPLGTKLAGLPQTLTGPGLRAALVVGGG